MQHNDERPTVSGRPSLLSTEQQAEADRQRLGALDDNAPGAAGSTRKYSWLAAGFVAVVALGAGSAAWLSAEGEKEIVLATTSPLPATPAAPAALASDAMPQLPPQDAAVTIPGGAAPVNPEADDVSTAAILEDAPALSVKSGAPEVKKPYEDELTKLLDQPAPAPQSNTPQLTVATNAVGSSASQSDAKPVPAMVKLADKPAVKKTVIAKAATPKPAPKLSQTASQKSAQNVTPTVSQKAAQNVTPTVSRKGASGVASKGSPAKPEKHPLAAAPSKKKNELHPKARADSDVALLAALMAHSKATQPKRGSAAAEKLKQCKTLASVAQADECRERLCASSASKEAECKMPGMAKAPRES